MEKIFDKLIEFIESLPPTLQVVSISVLAIIVMVYKLLTNSKIQQRLLLSLQKKLNKITSKELSSHRLFSRKSVYINTINNIKFSSKNKIEVFKIILKTKLDVDVEKTKAFIEDKKIYNLEINDLTDKMVCCINDMIQTYESESLDKLKILFGPDKAIKLFDTVMDSPGGFREKRCYRLNRLINQIDEYLRVSQVFDNNVERVEYFLTEVLYALRTSILEAEKVFYNLNGDIDKIVNG